MPSHHLWHALAIPTMAAAGCLAPESGSILRITELCTPANDVAVHQVASLKSPFSKYSFGPQSKLLEDRHGRFIVAPADSVDDIQVFDRHGVFLRRVSLKQPDGTLRRITASAMSPFGDLLLFVRDSAARSEIVVLAAETPDLSFKRRLSVNLTVPPFAILVSTQRNVFVHARIRTPSRAGHPLHLLDASGRLGRSFGALDRRLDPARPFADLRVIANAQPSDLWIGHRDAYKLDRFSETGAHVLTLQRNLPWFSSAPPALGIATPSLVGIHQPTSSLLLVAINRPRSTDAPEQRATEPTTHDDGALQLQEPGSDDANERLQTMLLQASDRFGGYVEVLDLDALCSRGSTELTGAVSSVSSSGSIQLWRASSHARSMEIWKLQSLQPNR